MNERISFWSQIWSPLVITETPARKRSMVILPVIPRPPAAFSPLTMMKSNAYFAFSPAAGLLPRRDLAGQQCRQEKEPLTFVGDSLNRYTVTSELRFNDISVHRSIAAKRFAWHAVTWRRRVVRASTCLFAAILAAGLQAAENISVLGNKPRWDVLEHYQQTITHDEFAHLINDVYATHGFAPDLIEIKDDTARILMNRDAQKFFTLRFAWHGRAETCAATLATGQIFTIGRTKQAALGFKNRARPRTSRRQLGEDGRALVPSRR